MKSGPGRDTCAPPRSLFRLGHRRVDIPESEHFGSAIHVMDDGLHGVSPQPAPELTNMSPVMRMGWVRAPLGPRCLHPEVIGADGAPSYAMNALEILDCVPCHLSRRQHAHVLIQHCGLLQLISSLL